VILGALAAFGPLSTDAYLPGLPQLTRDFGAPAWAAQLTLTASMLGIAFGQLIAGPSSDSLGRRRPLLAGLVGYAVASAACAAAPSVAALIVMRVIQGFAGGVGIVIARAIVRDRFEGTDAAKMYATLMIVTGVAPICAPLVGGQALRFTSWRGIFVGLAVIGVVLLVVVALRLPETVGPDERRSGGLGDTFRPLAQLLADPVFAATALAFSLAFGAMFANISGLSFVLEDVYGLSPQAFSLVFSLNACGLVAASQIGGRLVARFGAPALFRAGLTGILLAGAATLTVTLTGAGLAFLLPSLFLLMSSGGLAMPNGMATAMHGREQVLGSAAALLGLGQFGLGALVAPLVGVGGAHDALPMAIVIATCGTCAFALERATARRRALVSAHG
jgi:DHA1 family bicyclomycin/chloramphenicol resistance-like MFS transporter